VSRIEDEGILQLPVLYELFESAIAVLHPEIKGRKIGRHDLVTDLCQDELASRVSRLEATERARVEMKRRGSFFRTLIGCDFFTRLDTFVYVKED
jgi:hypothetical protein